MARKSSNSVDTSEASAFYSAQKRSSKRRNPWNHQIPHRNKRVWLFLCTTYFINCCTGSSLQRLWYCRRVSRIWRNQELLRQPGAEAYRPWILHRRRTGLHGQNEALVPPKWFLIVHVWYSSCWRKEASWERRRFARMRCGRSGLLNAANLRMKIGLHPWHIHIVSIRLP